MFLTGAHVRGYCFCSSPGFKKKKNLNDSPRVSQLVLVTPRVMQSEREAQSERGEEKKLPKEGVDFLIGFRASM